MLRPDKSGLSMTASGRSRERRSVGPLLSTLRLGQPRADVLTSRMAVFGYERSVPQRGGAAIQIQDSKFQKPAVGTSPRTENLRTPPRNSPIVVQWRLVRLRKNSFGVSFRGAAAPYRPVQGAGDEESRIGLKTLRARFLAEFTLGEMRRSFSRDCGIRMTANGLGMTAWKGFPQRVLPLETRSLRSVLMRDVRPRLAP
jgi:hypothetical protein